MNKKIFLFFIITGFSLLFFGSCNSGENVDSDNLSDETLDSADIDEEILISMLAPSDMAVQMINIPKLHFDKEILNPSTNYQKYNTNSKIALNIGIYTADLSYASLFDQEQVTYNYLDIVKDMSEEIGISQTIEKRHLDMIKNSKLDKDDVLKIINESFMNTDAYLKENNREKLITMILIGGWIEAQYIAVSLTDGSPDTNPRLTENILAQKISLELMNRQLENIKNDNTLAPLKKDMEKIYNAYLSLNENIDKNKFKEFCDLIIQIRNSYV